MIEYSFRNDADGNPAGGWIKFQDGSEVQLQNGLVQEKPNGAFVEDFIVAAVARLEFYNKGKFRCRENSLAITKLEEALHWLEHRTRDRQSRGVENTHEV